MTLSWCYVHHVKSLLDRHKITVQSGVHDT